MALDRTEKCVEPGSAMTTFRARPLVSFRNLDASKVRGTPLGGEPTERECGRTALPSVEDASEGAGLTACASREGVGEGTLVAFLPWSDRTLASSPFAKRAATQAPAIPMITARRIDF
jgi:hypothetical protein